MFYVVTWAWKGSKETAAVASRLGGELRIERPLVAVPKQKGGVDVAKLGGKLSVHIGNGFMITDQCETNDVSSALRNVMH